MFRDTEKKFVLQHLLKTTTNRNYNVDHANLSDKKNVWICKGMNFDVKAPGNKNPRYRSLIKLIKSPAIMASGISTNFRSSDPNEIYDRLKLLLQEKQDGNISVIINEEMVAIVDNLLEYKCISRRQH